MALAEDWIAAGGGYSDAWETMYELVHHRPLDALALIEEIHTRLSRDDFANDEIRAVLSAGPLEDLLAEHGPIVIDRIEANAKNDQLFRDLLDGVWQSSMSDELWERVRRAVEGNS